MNGWVACEICGAFYKTTSNVKVCCADCHREKVRREHGGARIVFKFEVRGRSYSRTSNGRHLKELVADAVSNGVAVDDILISVEMGH